MFNGRAVVRFSGIFQSVGSPGGSLLNTNTFTQREGEATKNYLQWHILILRNLGVR